jgi:membrane fusion protein (multidrug efflux system)
MAEKGWAGDGKRMEPDADKEKVRQEDQVPPPVDTDKKKHRLRGGGGTRLARFKLNSPPRIILATILIVLAAAAAYYWWYSSHWVSTDDAQIDGNIDPISARIAGHVGQVTVEDGQFVQTGTLLVEIDPTDYQIAYERAKAEYENAVAKAAGAHLNVPVTATDTSSRLAEALAGLRNAQSGVTAAQEQLNAAKASLNEAEAEDTKAQADLRRYTVLLADDTVAREKYDEVLASAKTAAAKVEAARALVKASQANVFQARGQMSQATAQLRAASSGPKQVGIARSQAESAVAAVQTYKAALDQAEFNLRYTKVSAPVSGIIGDKAVDVGQNVSPGQVLMDIVPVNGIWVTANFKETALRNVRPGQPVKIYVDAYGKEYDGHVDSIGGATGARFSLFPPENATGNYVKVVQRVPVKIVFEKGQDKEHLLRLGMSVVPRVEIK